MSTTPAPPGKTRTAVTAPSGPGCAPGARRLVAVPLGAWAWGLLGGAMRACSAGGRRRPHRGGAPSVTVQVGTCLTYAYGQAANDSLPCTRAWPPGGLG